MKTRCLKWYRNVYNFLKKNIKRLLPKSFLFKNELFFRYFYGIFYSGNTQQCNVCEKHLKSFINKSNNDLLCPFCGSLSRTRRLWSILNSRNSIKGNILHFSPSRSIFRKLKKLNNINYFSSDFENEFLADYKFDITQINEENETFDTIICYHILEHIINDKAAISELFRVLKPKGKAIIQTPFKDGDIYEDFSITSPIEREKHFGQNDHVRVYSVLGLKERLEIAGFKVEIASYNTSEKDAYHGFKSPETILIASKN